MNSSGTLEAKTKQKDLVSRYMQQSVAAPDHKIRQCIQRSALFPGRADGGTEGLERGEARDALKPEGVPGSGKGGRSPYPLACLGAMPQNNFQKPPLKLCILCILQTEMVLSAVSARPSIRHCNCYLLSYRQIQWAYM